MNKLKGRVYDWVLSFATLGFRRKTATPKILIVRVDEIGDYMLWHPFLKELTNAERFNGYEFHFCGNKSWQSLFDTFDKELVSKCFWMDKTGFKKKMSYRYRFLRSVFQENYTIVINPTFSRDKRNDDSIVKAAKAKERIGMVSNLETVKSYEAGYDKELYTQLFVHAESPIFEFERNRLFTEFVTSNKSTIPNTSVDTSRLPALHLSLPEKYFVVFPGSRSAARIWPVENFVRVAQYLFDQYGWTAVVAGTNSDAVYTEAFCAQYTNPVLNIAGKTSLSEMLSLLKYAQCLLSVDTGSVHLAAAVNCTVFGVFNGSQYKRFAPYPPEIASNMCPVYPDDVEIELKDAQLVKTKYEFVVEVPYASVKAEKMILAIHNHFILT
ncbi:MAG: glycosyltransferase family 9 protein [Bacteroidota bacterium]